MRLQKEQVTETGHMGEESVSGLKRLKIALS